MNKLILGIIIGTLLTTGISFAFRTETPPVLTLPLDENEINRLNNYLEQVWFLNNGLYTPDIITATPNNSRKGSKGEFVFFNDSGTFKLFVNTDGLKSWQQIQ